MQPCLGLLLMRITVLLQTVGQVLKIQVVTKLNTTTSSKTYTLTCTGNGGSASDSVYVAVEDNNQNITPSVTTNSPSGLGTNYANSKRYVSP